MTALHKKTRTLSQLRRELATRLGFVSVGQAAVMHDPLLTSFLQESAEQIYAQYGDDLLFLVNETFPIGEGERFHSFPETADPYKIDDVLIEVDGRFTPVYRGIPEHARTAGNNEESKRGIPARWDIAAGTDPDNPGVMEFWPVPNKEYTIHMSFYPIYAEDGWTGEDDPCPIYPSRLCLLLAQGNAKSHFGMGDASNYYQQFDELLKKTKAGLLYGVRFVKPTQFGNYVDEGVGNRPIEGGNIIADLTPPESITGETGDTILPESSA